RTWQQRLRHRKCGQRRAPTSRGAMPLGLRKAVRAQDPTIVEVVNAVRDQGYRNDGIAFYASAVPLPGLVPLLRLSHPEGKYLYTTSFIETYGALLNEGYAFDNVSCYVSAAPAMGLASLYRLDNSAQKDSSEAQQAVTHSGYVGVGLAGHVL